METYSSTTKPTSEKVITKIENLLKNVTPKDVYTKIQNE